MISLAIVDDKPLTQIERLEAMLRAHPEGVDTISWCRSPLCNEWRARMSQFRKILIKRGNKEKIVRTHLSPKNNLFKLVAVCSNE